MKQSSIHISKVNENDPVFRLNITKEEIIKTLSYFDIFHYPLTYEEIKQFGHSRVEEDLLHAALSQLIEKEKIFYYAGFYSIQNNQFNVHRRKQGNQRAEKLLVKARRIGRFLYRFPFVRGIGISGSLSKNYADENADIDFFIITKSNRLWIARTFMHLFKKLTYLAGRQHFYCMNYYIDEEGLPLEEKNIFTAIEIKTLVPVSGDQTLKLFFEANRWTDEWLPASTHKIQQQKDPSPSLFKRSLEWLLNANAGTWLENYLFRVSTRRWKRKTEKGMLNKKGLPMGLITGRHFAISNPGDFREKVLALYEKKISDFSLG